MGIALKKVAFLALGERNQRAQFGLFYWSLDVSCHRIGPLRSILRHDKTDGPGRANAALSLAP